MGQSTLYLFGVSAINVPSTHISSSTQGSATQIFCPFVNSISYPLAGYWGRSPVCLCVIKNDTFHQIKSVFVDDNHFFWSFIRRITGLLNLTNQLFFCFRSKRVGHVAAIHFRFPVCQSSHLVPLSVVVEYQYTDNIGIVNTFVNYIQISLIFINRKWFRGITMQG